MEARSSSSMIGTLLSGRYRLEAKLGSGGMSTVYLARDEKLDRPVAVKAMHREISEQADQLERFRQEARAVAKLSHPNVVSVIDAGEDARSTPRRRSPTRPRSGGRSPSPTPATWSTATSSRRTS
jgi:serine/threonine protein kinase